MLNTWCAWESYLRACIALGGDPVAPGNDATLKALQDPRKRPLATREPLPRDVQDLLVSLSWTRIVS